MFGSFEECANDVHDTGRSGHNDYDANDTPASDDYNRTR
jgi:hypothetical protein